MADGVVFSIGGYEMLCPKLVPGWFEPGDIDYSYLNGSKIYIGMPAMTYTWPVLDETDVATIRLIYEGLVTAGTPLTATVPDFLNGGWKYTTCYMTEPTGTAGGSITTNFSVKLYNLGEQNLLDHMASPETNLWDLMQLATSLEIGGAEYPSTSWQFS